MKQLNQIISKMYLDEFQQSNSDWPDFILNKLMFPKNVECYLACFNNIQFNEHKEILADEKFNEILKLHIKNEYVSFEFLIDFISRLIEQNEYLKVSLNLETNFLKDIISDQEKKYTDLMLELNSLKHEFHEFEPQIQSLKYHIIEVEQKIK
jgi:hypothetical protein